MSARKRVAHVVVPKSNIRALVLERGESEVVVLPWDIPSTVAVDRLRRDAGVGDQPPRDWDQNLGTRRADDMVPTSKKGLLCRPFQRA
jgi:hypothetical protein